MAGLLGSFGASAALLFAAPALPVSQPRNVIGGHMISAAAGISSFYLIHACAPQLESLGASIGLAWSGGEVFALPLACMLATPCMLATRTFHPPAAGTAMICVFSPVAHELGITFALAPVGTG